MLNAEEIREKLKDLAADFNEYVEAKQYFEAKYCYEVARMVTVFIELPEIEQIELFGNQWCRNEKDGDEVIKGLFDEKKVAKTVYETAVKRNREIERQEKERNKQVIKAIQDYENGRR